MKKKFFLTIADVEWNIEKTIFVYYYLEYIAGDMPINKHKNTPKKTKKKTSSEIKNIKK